MNKKLSVIIIDDESLARKGLMLRLEKKPNFEVIAQCASADLALSVIGELKPDIAFLDIEMPGMSGIELAQHLATSDSPTPKIVFVTAYREFALNAFEFQAFDYLLKPFSDERLNACLIKLADAFGEKEVMLQHQKLDSLLNSTTGDSINGFIQNLESSTAAPLSNLQQTISLKSGFEWLRVKLDHILWIEAAGDYMCVHTLEGTHIIRKTLKQFEDELNSFLFVRLSRSAIVNVNKIVKLKPNSNGEYLALLSSGDEVKVSRKYKNAIDELKKTKP